MSSADIADWQPVFDDLVLDLQQSDPPEGASGQWHQAMAKFSRHSYARLLLSPTDDGLEIYLEIALGPDPGDRTARALDTHLSRVADTDWERTTEEARWLLRTRIPDGDDGRDRLRRVLMALIEIAERFETVDSSERWIDILREDGDEGETDAGDRTGEAPSGDAGPFETIGDGGSPRPGDEPGEDDRQATIEQVASTRVDDHIVAAIGFPELLAPRHLDALEDGLRHHLQTKFEVRAHPLRQQDQLQRAELRMPSQVKTVLQLQIDIDDYPGNAGKLKRDVDGFLNRLARFSSFGVDLFEYLGVGETVLDSSDRPRREPSDDDESQLSFRRRAPTTTTDTSHQPEPTGDEDATVLDLQAPAESTGALKSGNYTDPRLRREDATTPLVDVVLRHPGYSDGRIGQVLSILLSIEYHDALDIADSAPCVIAWGVSNKRARRFKEVIESAGGKVVLVEPETFGGQ